MRFTTAAALSVVSVFLVLAPAAQAQSDWWGSFTAQAPAVDQSGRREWVWQGKDSLHVGGSGHVRYVPGGAPRIIVTGDPDEVAKTEVDGGTIRRHDTSGFNFSFSRNEPRVEILVQGVMLSRFEVAGSAVMDLGRLQRDTLELRVSGSGALNVQGQARQLGLQVNGSGHANLEQMSAGAAEISVNGSGSTVMGDVSEGADIRVTGSGRAKIGDIGKSANIQVTGSGTAILGRVPDVKANLTGSGTVRLSSQPVHSDYHFTGSGKILLVGADGRTTELAGADMERAQRQREREAAQAERQRQRERDQADRERERERQQAERERERAQRERDRN